MVDMVSRSRRRLLHALGMAAPATMLPRWAWQLEALGDSSNGIPAALAGETRGFDPSLPDPSRQYRGFSSLELELAHGTPETRAEFLRGARPAHGERARFPWAEVGQQLRSRFDDLERHFIFEYYPWYGNDPWTHWQQWDRVPPHDIAATSVPRLGAYDSRDTKVLEQHARWIKEIGAGAINTSWWGRNSYSGRNAPLLLDVMADHDIKVMFHIEPYKVSRNESYLDDITFLIQEYGDKRSWDAMLVLRNADGKQGPVFKTFRTLVAESKIDCHGVEQVFEDYTPDSEWAGYTDSVRERFRSDFDHVTLLADSTNVVRMRDAGFDGMAIYNNFLDPSLYEKQATRSTREDLVFSFNCNPGFDSIARRIVPADSCYEPNPFHPAVETPLDWSQAAERERARKLSKRQIRRTLATSVFVQSDPQFNNVRRGFFLVFLNSFNEWHEGHQFEPAKDDRDLTDKERAVGYHNPRRGDYRFRYLRNLMRKMLAA